MNEPIRQQTCSGSPLEDAPDGLRITDKVPDTPCGAVMADVLKNFRTAAQRVAAEPEASAPAAEKQG